MGIFDWLKKKKSEQNTKPEKFCPYCGIGLKQNDTVCYSCKKDLAKPNVVEKRKATFQTDSGVKLEATISVSKPAPVKKIIKTHIKNGIKYNTVSVTDLSGGTFTQDVAEYNEVFYFYSFMNKYKVLEKPEVMREADFSKWALSFLDIKRFSDFYKELCDKGFYGPADNKTILSKMNVGPIKETASTLGLAIKGKKDELIEQLLSAADSEVLNKTLNSTLYSLTEKALKWMDDHKDEYGFYTSDKDFVSLEEYLKFWSENDPDDVKIREYLAEIKTDKKDFGRYAYDGIIKLYEKKGDKERDILVCLGKELLLDLSGVYVYKDWKELFNWNLEDGDQAEIYFTPYLLRTIPGYKNYYDEAVIEEIYSLKLPMNVCAKETFKDIFEMILDGALDGNTQKDYINELKQKAKEFAKSKRRK